MSRPAGANRGTCARAIALAVSLGAVVVAASGSTAAMQQAGVARAVPTLGAAVEQSLARGESHEWQIDLGSAEYLAVSVEPAAPADADEWPSVALIAPGGETVYEDHEPTVAPSIDGWAVTVVIR